MMRSTGAAADYAAEVVQLHGAHHVDLIQTSCHEQWDGNTVLGNSHDHGLSERLELSEWVEQVVRHLSSDDFPPDHTTTTTPGLSPEQTSFDIYGENYKRARKNITNAQYDHYQLYWSTSPSSTGTGTTALSTSASSDHINVDHIIDHEDQAGLLSSLTLLLECAVAISVENLAEANRMVLQLTQSASPYSPSCAERVVAYFAKAMRSRVINSCLGAGLSSIISPLNDADIRTNILSAFQAFNSISPFIKFSHFTSNQAILEAFQNRDRVHIVDLDIMQGLQWPALFHILATRPEGPPRLVRMTALGSSLHALKETGRQLTGFANRLGLVFEFHPVRFGELTTAWPRREETVALHWLRHSLYDATGGVGDWETMRFVERVRPRVVTLVEQDIAHSGSFLDRFAGSLHYYSTVFDSLGATLACEDPDRYRVEHDLLSREIGNVLAVGGPRRSGPREKWFRSWRGEMGRRGRFVQVGMSGNAMAQAQLILNMFPPSHGYTILQGDGTLRLGWKQVSLYTASAWTSTQ